MLRELVLGVILRPPMMSLSSARLSSSIPLASALLFSLDSPPSEEKRDLLIPKEILVVSLSSFTLKKAIGIW